MLVKCVPVEVVAVLVTPLHGSAHAFDLITAGIRAGVPLAGLRVSAWGYVFQRALFRASILRYRRL